MHLLTNYYCVSPVLLILTIYSYIICMYAVDNADYFDVSSDESIKGCIYTFYVPHNSANSCPPGSSEKDNNANFEKIQMSLSKERALLSDKLDYLSKIINNLTAPISSDNIDQSNSDSSTTEDKTDDVKRSSIGTHYTRWGSTSCPNSADLLYSGFSARSHNSHGGGANFLCLPKEPEFPDNAEAGFQSQSYIYGVEYEKHTSPVIPSDKNNNDVPCALCHVVGKSEQLMIPAKQTCPNGWTREYHGFLMAQHHRQQSSTFICVDKNLEVLTGGSPNAEGGHLYPVEAFCGSLICPPYINGYELSCVVCTL